MKTRLALGARAIPLDSLAKLEPMAGTNFAGQVEFDAWLKEQGLDEAASKQVMTKVATTVRASGDTVYCIGRADGKTLWKKELLGNWMWYPAASTPAVADGRCYILGSTAIAYCLDAKDGNVLWETKPLGAAQHSHNRSSSVLLLDGKAVFCTDTGLAALDAKTGETVWRNDKVQGKEASAAPWRAGDKNTILFTAGNRLVCIDPADGKLLWSATTGATASTPVVAGDVAVICTGAKESGITAFRISAEGAKPLWTVPFVDWSSSAVVFGKHFYVIGGGNGTGGFGEQGKGRALCIEIESGKVAWEVMIGDGPQLSSPALADGKLIAEVGPWLYVIKAAPEKYELIGKANLGLASWTSPAVADGLVFARTGKGVSCYDLRQN